MQTAADSNEEIAEGIRAGAFYYLTKPYEVAVVISITAAAVEDRKRFDSLRAEVATHAEGLSHLTQATFRFRNLAEVETIAATLALACPEPEDRIGGLTELLVNAVEHGNAGITYEDKNELLVANKWRDEVARRLSLPENSAKDVTVEFARADGEIEISIRDQGPGFDWHKYLELDPSRVFDTHGRGIALARALSFDDVEYRGNGSHVVATIKLDGKDG